MAAGVDSLLPKQGFSDSFNETVLPYHDRMPVVLEPGEIDDFLAGRMRHFQPPAEILRVADAANPLLKTPRPVQGELF